MKFRLLYLTLALPAVLPAQTYSFQHYGVEDGLSQSAVTAVVQDNNGIMWVGTMAGLNRYDGTSFRTYGKEEGLTENWVTALLKDSRGTIWIGHWGGGVSLCNAASGKVRDMKFERFSKFKSVTSIMEDANGDVWFGTAGGGVFKYEALNNEIVSLGESDGFLSNYINSISTDAKGNIWFGTDHGIIIFKSGKKLEDRNAFATLNQSGGLPSDRVTAISRAGADKMAVATEFSGIAIVEVTGGDWKFKCNTLNTAAGLPSNFISSVMAGKDEEIWIGSRDEGMFRYDMKKKRIQSLSVRQGLNYFKVNCLFRDREENMWIGTDLGLNLYRGDQFLKYDESDGLTNNVVWSVTEDSDHHIWLGTNSGLSKLKTGIKSEGGGYDAVKVVNFNTSGKQSDNTILSLYADGDGRIWCGTRYSGLSVLDKDGKKIAGLDSVSGLASNTVYSIAADGNGNCWLGTDRGVSLVDGKFKVTNYSTADGLGGSNVYKVYCDSRGRVWFASIGGSLSYFINGKFSRISERDLSQKFITSICEDSKGIMWFGAYGAGIFSFNGKKFSNYTMANGLSSNSPSSVIADSEGNIWIGTNKGIDKFMPADGITKSFGENEGFMGVEPNPNAVCIDHRGNIWYGTIMGAVRFSLADEKKNTVEPVTMLENIKVDYEPFDFPEDNEFSYSDNHITFHYIGVSLTNPEHVEYKYMLKGFDNDWSPVTHNQDVVYSNLSPGDYEFLVMASNNDGVWNQLPASYPFKINPPFWSTWWFYTLCTIIVAAAVYLGDKIRMKKIMEAKALLEKKVEERTAEVVEQKNLVEEKNKEILDSIKYAKRIQEAILPPIKVVKEYLHDSFILYKPKDIVAGDFYWFETKDDEIFVAAADCTGHGVPGAMVSVVCANSLNRAVNELNLRQPAEILNKTREFVVSNFEKSERQVQDGMDISFCRINLRQRKLIYSGAHNPVYRITGLNGEADDKAMKGEKHMLLEYRGDKQPIGKFDYAKPFTQTEIALEAGDCLYLSTDGFADQFGGENEKKFMHKHFKQMFLNVHEMPMEKQKSEIDRIFESWKGSIVQIDDVCIIGIRIS